VNWIGPSLEELNVEKEWLSLLANNPERRGLFTFRREHREEEKQAE